MFRRYINAHLHDNIKHDAEFQNLKFNKLYISIEIVHKNHRYDF